MGLFTGSREYIPTIVFTQLVIFIVLVSCFILMNIVDLGRDFFLFIAILGLIFLLLGITLIVLTLKQKIKGKLKIFLILTGVSAICPLIFSILHNLFYALAVITSHITVLRYLMELLHVVSFFISLIIGPVGFLVGVIGSLVLLAKKRKSG